MLDKLTRGQREVVGRALGEAEPVADLSWGQMDTVVLRMRDTAGTEFTVKAAGPGNHHIGREIAAHESSTAPLVKIGRTPRLIAADREENVLVTTYLAGSLVAGTADETNADVHRQAGSLLRLLHDAAAPIHDDGSWEAGENAKMLGRLDGPHRIPPALARDAAQILHSIRPRSVAVVPTHGDWQPRNWIIDGNTVSVIDYGRYDLRPALTDLTRPAEQQWRLDPALADAHADGYGRDLRDDPRWHAVLLREAIGTAVWAHQMAIADFEAQGLRMLADAVTRF